jgi:hypothetical protein
MKKLSAIVLLGLASAFGLQAQVYDFDPGRDTSGTVDPGGTLQMTIYINNLSSGILEMEWSQLSTTFPGTWTVQICDNATCVEPAPGNIYAMNPVPVGDHAFLKAMITPNGNTGMGTIKVLVWQRGHGATPDTVSFSAESVVGIEDAALLQGVSLSPNPVHETLRLVTSSTALENGTLSIYSLNGQLLRSHATVAGMTVETPVADLPPGLYVVALTTEAGSFRQKFVKL